MQKRLNEIVERKSALLGELKDADEKRIVEIQGESDALNQEEKELRSKMDLQGKLAPAASEKVKPNEVESRAASFAKTGRMAIPASETRSTLLSGGAIAAPAGVGGINDPANTVSSIIDLVNVEDMTGMGSYQEAFVSAWASAGAGSEGTVANASDPTFKIANIIPFDIDVVSYVSKQIRKQTPLQYAQKVQAGALKALRKKVVDYIVSGNGSTEPFGIPVAADKNAVATCDTLKVTSSTIDDGTLRDIVFAYGGDENVGAGARLILNKNDLIAFGDVRGTSEKKAVYEIIPDGDNPNVGIIKDGGLSVPYVFCSDVTALSDSTYSDADISTMIYGNPANYKLGLFGDFEVAVSEDYKFGEGLLTVRGEVMVGGNVVVDKGFLVVTLTTAE